MNFCS